MHLVCGEALYDVFVEQEKGDDLGEIALRAIGGGSPYNVAIGLARHGERAALATDIGRDGLGDRLVRRIVAEGVSEQFVRRTVPSTALAFVTLDANGTPRYDFYGLEVADYAPDFASTMARSGDITNLHFGSVALVLARSAGALLELAASMPPSVLVSLDPNVRLSIEPSTSRWRDAIEAARCHAHVVKVSEEDIAMAYGDEVDPALMCQRWLSGRTELVALTRGAAGASLFSRSGIAARIPAVEASMVDTVGAGDAFMAALLARLAQRGLLSGAAIASLVADQLDDLGWFSAAAAALTCSARGPALPRGPDVEALVARCRAPARAPAGT